MPRGDKNKYSDKQIRKAEHIEQRYERKNISKGEAEKRAWATVNKQSGSADTKESLLKKARQKNIAGRSNMNKQQLINALAKT
jgi:hypothetical protein